MWGGAARTRASGLKARAIAAAYGSPFAVGNANFHFPDYSGPADTVPYGFWRKDVFCEIGLFDETLVRNQDDEFNLRILLSGRSIWQSGEIVSWYKPRNSFRKLFKQYYQYGHWKPVVFKKHRTPSSWRQFVPAAFVFSCASLFLCGFVFPFCFSILLWILAVYGAFIMIGTIKISWSKGWILFPLIPLAIVTFHVSYGTGFLVGAVKTIRGRRRGPVTLSR